MKNIDYTPDITSAEFWDRHHVALVRVVEMGETLRAEVVRRFSAAPIDRPLTFAPRDLWLGLEPEAEPTPVAGDRLILYVPRTQPAPVIVRPATDTLVRRLEAIAGLLGAGPAALRQSIGDADPEVARYSLRRLLEAPGPAWPPADLARLRAVRDGVATAPAVRVLAAELAGRLEGREAELYGWLRNAILQSGQQDWPALRVFVRRLASFSERREETADFLAATATNEFLRQPIRIAAYSVFEDRAVFDFGAPDAASEQVFQASERMLNSRSPLIRRAGAALLHNLSAQIDPRASAPYVERANSAIGAAVTRERNAEARAQMGHFLDLVRARGSH